MKNSIFKLFFVAALHTAVVSLMAQATRDTVGIKSKSNSTTSDKKSSGPAKKENQHKGTTGASGGKDSRGQGADRNSGTDPNGSGK